jgi:hypothetical protein
MSLTGNKNATYQHNSLIFKTQHHYPFVLGYR